MKKKFIILFILISSILIFAQNVIIAQFLDPEIASFERLPEYADNNPPLGWYSCGYGSSPDTEPQAGIDIVIPASHGERYISLRTRGYSDDDYYNRKIDKCYTSLNTPFVSGSCYIFTIDLATDTEVLYADTDNENGLEPTTPVKFQVYGLNTVSDECDNKDLLGETNAITDTVWNEYYLVLYPEKMYNMILIQSYYAIEDSTYHGITLADNIRIREGSTNPVPVIVLDTIAPYNTILQLNASAGIEYTWTPPDELSCDDCRNPFTTVYEDIAYNVFIKHDTACFTEDVFNITLVECLTETSIIKWEDYVSMGEQITLTASNSHFYNWIPMENLSCTEDCQSTSFMVEKPVEYQCKIRDENGCTVIERFIAKIKITVPDVFTPNGDGINDLLIIDNLPENSRLKIFDRNSVLLYKSDNYQQNWDGRDSNGNLLKQDNYWFELISPFSDEIQYGCVYLKRN